MTAATIARPMPVLPRGRLDDRAAGLELAAALGVLDHRQRDAVLDRAAGIGALRLHPHFGAVAEQAVDADVRRVADGLEDVGGLHAAGLLRWVRAGKSGASKLFARRSSGNHHAHRRPRRSRPTPPATTAATGPISAAEEARFGLAQLVRGGDEQRRDRADPAAHRVGRVELDQRLADIDREHVGRAEQREAGERQRHRARQAEDDRRRAEHADRAAAS